MRGFPYVIPTLKGEATFFAIAGEAAQIVEWLGRRGQRARIEEGPDGRVSVAFGERCATTGDWLIDTGGGIALAKALHPEPDPIVWDGTDEAFKAIRSALSGIADDVLAPNTDGVLRELVLLCHGGGVLSCTHGGRIQAIGDSFIILPPEVTP